NYAPDVLDSVVEAARISAIGDIIYGFLGFVLAFVAYKIFYILYYMISKSIEERSVEFFCSLLAIGIVFSIVSICMMSNLIDIWNWVGVFNPKLALAHKITGI
ncbi:MAG: hypothetical protein ACR2MX_01710, partial [Cyclobacteriaceae bacterium]